VLSRAQPCPCSAGRSGSISAHSAFVEPICSPLKQNPVDISAAADNLFIMKKIASRSRDPVELSAIAGKALDHVRMHGPCEQGDLARVLGVSVPTTSRLVTKLLASRHLVAATPEPGNGRGRPPVRLAFNPASGSAIVANFSASS